MRFLSPNINYTFSSQLQVSFISFNIVFTFSNISSTSSNVSSYIELVVDSYLKKNIDKNMINIENVRRVYLLKVIVNLKIIIFFEEILKL